MTGQGNEPDLFRRAPRAPRLTLTARGWNGEGQEVCWFVCRRCKKESGMTAWPHADIRRPTCAKCAGAKR